MSIGDSPDDRDVRPVPLGARTRDVARCFVEALGAYEIGRETLPLRAEKVTFVVDEFELWSSSASVSIRLGLRGLLWIVELLPLFVIGRLVRASKLPLTARIAYLEEVERSPRGLLSTAFMGLKIPFAALLFEEGAELAETGFDRATLATPRKLPVVLPVLSSVTSEATSSAARPHP